MSNHRCDHQKGDFFEDLWLRHPPMSGKLALPESSDERILRAAHHLLGAEKLDKLWLFTERQTTLQKAHKLAIDLQQFDSKIVWAGQEVPELIEITRQKLATRWQAKGKPLGDKNLQKMSESSLFQAGMLLKDGQFDAAVAGSQATTAHVLKAVLSTIGLAPDHKTLSSAMLMAPKDHKNIKLFSDIAVLPMPDAAEICDIAHASVKTWQRLFPKIDPQVCFLSFSTKGSSDHPSPLKMAHASSMFRKKFPAIISDGELQFDAAIDPQIRKIKAPHSLIKNHSNIFIFPSLDAGNIAYKITQRLGNYQAIGPIIQGSAKPYFDLSRGASIEDIIKTCTLALSLRSV